MKTLLTLITLVHFLSGCGAQRESSQLTASSSRESCEVKKPMIIKPGSEFPSDEIGIFRSLSTTAQAECTLGGFGWVVSSWNISFVVEVQNVAFEKRFVIETENGIDHPDRIVIDPAKVTFLGADLGYDRFRFQHKVSNLAAVKLSVIMPARFNATPTISDPTPGWTGPTYGQTVQVQN